MEKNDTAVCITSFNRPNYVRRCIRSLERCVDKETVDWHLMQGGAVNKFSGERWATDQEIADCLEILENADLPNKTLHVNSENVGIAIQRDRIWSLFDEGYEYVYHVEGDIVVGKYFLRLARILMDQFPEYLGSMYRSVRAENVTIDGNLDQVLISDHGAHMVDFLHRDTFSKIEDDWNQFIDIVWGHDFPRGDTPDEELADEFTEGVDGSDKVLSYITRMNDVLQVKPVVSRASDIGEYGMYHTPEKRADMPAGEEGQLEYAEDADIERFEVHSKDFYRNGPDDPRL